MFAQYRNKYAVFRILLHKHISTYVLLLKWRYDSLEWNYSQILFLFLQRSLFLEFTSISLVGNELEVL